MPDGAGVVKERAERCRNEKAPHDECEAFEGESAGLLRLHYERMRGLLEFFEVNIAPADVAFYSTMNLEAEKAFGGRVLRVGILEVDTLLSIEPGLDMVPDALDSDLVPAFHFGSLEALLGEVGHVLFITFVWEEPAATSFIEEAGGP